MYTGDVDSYGPADYRLLPDLLVAKMGLGPHGVNGYVLRCVRTQHQLLIDAADDPMFIAAISSSRGLETIVSTCGHEAHTRALDHLAESTHATLVAHPDEAAALPVPPSRTVVDGDVLLVGAVSLTVLHLPGHARGSLALLYAPTDGPPHLFSGDALVRGGGVGVELRTHEGFDALPDATWVYPGHGRDTSLGRERGAPTASSR